MNTQRRFSFSLLAGLLVLAGMASLYRIDLPSNRLVATAALSASAFPTARNSLTPTSAPTILPSHTPTRTTIPSSPTPTKPTRTRAAPTATPAITSTAPASLLLPLRGKGQTLPLSCESRSAVDWAAHFGVKIDELVFQDQLPVSDNPEVGFVGDVNGVWGKTPPDSYGVHAAPVAALLRSYGLNAEARKGMTLDELKQEIAAGRPVIVWMVGHVEKGPASTYTTNDGQIVTVAAHEHTMIAIGYTRETIVVLDGAIIYGRANAHFLDSWGPLGNMAIVKRP